MNLRQHAGVVAEVGKPPLIGQRLLQARQVTASIIQGRGTDSDIVQAKIQVEINFAGNR